MKYIDPNNVSPPRKARVIDLFSSGMKVSHIATEMNMCGKTVSRILNNAGLRQVRAWNGPEFIDTSVKTPEARHSSTIYLVGYTMPPAWSVPYIEAGRVKMEQAR